MYVKDSESPVLGKERTRYLIGEFRRKYKEKFMAGELSSTDFEIGKCYVIHAVLMMIALSCKPSAHFRASFPA